MKNIIIGGLLIAAVGVAAFVGANLKSNNLGATMVVQSSYYGATSASSTVPNVATTTNPVLSLDADRTNAMVCNTSQWMVYLYPRPTSSTGGILVGAGIPLSPFGLTTSTANICEKFPGFKGYLFAIAEATSVVTVASWK